MTFREANGILAHKEKHSKKEIAQAEEAFGVEITEAVCMTCDRYGSCAMNDKSGSEEAIAACDFWAEEDTTDDEDYDTYD